LGLLYLVLLSNLKLRFIEMTSTITVKFFTFCVFLSLVFQLQADETTAMLRLTIDGEKISSGACLLSTTDFETAKFSIVDEDGQLLEKFKIIDGSLDWEVSRHSVTGAVLPDGTIDGRAILLLSTAQGKKVNITVRTHYGPNLLERTWKFHVYIDVIPQLVFGSIENGAMQVDLAYLRELRTVSAVFKTNPEFVKFKVIKGMITVKGLQGTGPILQNGQLHVDAIRLLQSAKGREVTVTVLCKDPAGQETKSTLVFTVAA